MAPIRRYFKRLGFRLKIGVREETALEELKKHNRRTDGLDIDPNHWYDYPRDNRSERP